jgi:glucokinase
LRTIESVLAYAKSEGLHVLGLGVSIPGTLDRANRRTLTIPILPSLNDLPLSDLLEARYNLPAQLYVDVDAAVLGEYHFGAGKGYRRLLFLNVNAVVGAALLIDGKLERFKNEYVGHVCHVLVSAGGPLCSCGKRGCINALVSLEALQKMVQRALRRGEQSSLLQRLSNREYFSQQLLAEEALRGDAVALQMNGVIGRWLGAATSKYIHKYEPNALILGGGALSESEALLASVRNVLSVQSPSTMCNIIEVIPSRLGTDAALIGSASPYFK